MVSPRRRPELALQRRFNCRDRATFLKTGTRSYAQGLEIKTQAGLRLRDQAVTSVLVGDGPAKAQLILMKEEHGLLNVVFADAEPLARMPAYYWITTAAIATLMGVSLFRGARPSMRFLITVAGIHAAYAGSGEGARVVEANRSGTVTPPADADALSASIMEPVRSLGFAHEPGRNARNTHRRTRDSSQSWMTDFANWDIVTTQGQEGLDQTEKL